MASGTVTTLIQQQVSNGAPDGWILGQSASDKGAFFGSTPVVQRATAASHTTIATTGSVSTTTGSVTSWGFSTSTQADAIIAAVAEMQATLVAYGLWPA